MVRSVARSVVPVCGLVSGLVSGPVGDPVGDPVGGPVGHLVDGPVCGLVDGPVCGPARAVSGPVETRPAPYNGLPASNAWILVGKRACVLMFPNISGQLGVLTILESQSDRPCRGFRVSHGAVLWCCCGAVVVLLRCCCGAVAVLLRCCCGVAVLLRWCCGSVAVVQSVVPVDGPVSGH